VRDDEHGLARVGGKEPFQHGPHAVVDLLQGLPAGLGAHRRAGLEIGGYRRRRRVRSA
jgi:hypothetical protein